MDKMMDPRILSAKVERWPSAVFALLVVILVSSVIAKVFLK
jgi:hypothetical protein